MKKLNLMLLSSCLSMGICLSVNAANQLPRDLPSGAYFCPVSQSVDYNHRLNKWEVQFQQGAWQILDSTTSLPTTTEAYNVSFTKATFNEQGNREIRCYYHWQDSANPSLAGAVGFKFGTLYDKVTLYYGVNPATEKGDVVGNSPGRADIITATLPASWIQPEGTSMAICQPTDHDTVKCPIPAKFGD